MPKNVTAGEQPNPLKGRKIPFYEISLPNPLQEEKRLQRETKRPPKTLAFSRFQRCLGHHCDEMIMAKGGGHFGGRRKMAFVTIDCTSQLPAKGRGEEPWDLRMFFQQPYDLTKVSLLAGIFN